MSIDIIGLIEFINLYLLPLVLAAVVLGARFLPLRPRDSQRALLDESGELRLERLDRERAVRWIGLLNYGLALRALVMIIPEIQLYLTAGGFSIFGAWDVGVPLFTVAVNLPIGNGLRRLRPWARWAELVWNLLLSAVTLPLFVWLLRHGARVSPADWPDLVIAKALPPFLALVMILPATARVVSAQHRALISQTPELSAQRVPRSLVSALVLGFLVLVGSVVVINALDWFFRIRLELNAFAPSPISLILT